MKRDEARSNSSIAAHVLPHAELLRGLEPPEIDLILSEARPRRFAAKSVITRESESGDQLFLLCKGRARYFHETFNGKKLIFVWITPGHTFGMAALEHTPSTYLVSTEAVRDSTVLVWDRPAIRSLAQRLPRLMENAFHCTAEYLRWAAATHAALASQNAKDRLANIILGFAPTIGHEVDGGTEIDVTNEELADAASMSHFTVSRIINEWQRTGAIRKDRGKIILRSRKAIFSRAA